MLHGNARLVAENFENALDTGLTGMGYAGCINYRAEIAGTEDSNLTDLLDKGQSKG